MVSAEFDFGKRLKTLDHRNISVWYELIVMYLEPRIQVVSFLALHTATTETQTKGKGNITIEVKSDQWKYTGNIALELLRDYNDSYERNIGSIIKTKADFWQEYYYDRKKDEVSSEMFYVKDLKDEVSKILFECI